MVSLKTIWIEIYYTVYVMDRVKSTIKHQYETIKQMLLLTLMLANRML